MKSRKFKRGEKFFFQIIDDNDKVKLESKAFSSKSDRNDALSEAMKPYASDGNSDDYKPLSFYQSNSNSEQGFDSFSGDGEHFFCYNVNGETYLISEGYSSEAGRDNGIKSVEKNMKDRARFSVNQLANGKWSLNLKAGNNQEIATSRWFNTEGDANAAIGRLTGTGGGGVAATGAGMAAGIVGGATPDDDEKKKRKKRASKPKAEKIPVSDGKYLDTDVSYYIHKSSGNGQHYFSYRNPATDKTILMNSDVRGFDSQADAENAILLVDKYGSTGTYDTRSTKNGKFWFYLDDESGTHVGKSIFFGSEDDMNEAIRLLKSGSGGAGVAAASSGARSEEGKDEYLPVSAYAAHSGSKVSGESDFISFETDGIYYFAWMVDGDVYMRSQGYTSEAGRDNGIESVKKNRDNEERYANLDEGGSEFVILKAGNSQEIARSGPIGGRGWTNYRAAGIGAIGIAGGLGAMSGGGNSDSAAAEAAAKAKADEEARAKAAADAKAKADEEARDKAEAEAKAKAEQEARDKAEAETKAKAEQEARDKAEAEAKAKAEQEARDKAEAEAKAKAEQEARDKAEAEAKAKAEQEARDKAEAEAKAKAEQEARDKAEAEAKAKAEEAKRESSSSTITKVAATAAAVGAGAVGMAAGSKKEKGDDDDYMVCSVYENRINDSRSSKYPEFITFKADNGEHYFALVKEGKIFLRSEGYTQADYRDNGIESVLKNKDNRDRFSVEKKRGLEYVILKSSGGHEIARSCPMKSGAAAWLPGAAVAATATAAAAAPIVRGSNKTPKKTVVAADKQERKVVETKKERVVTESTRERTTAAAAGGTVDGGGSGCMKYLLWLLPLLLIGALLWFLFGKGCNTATPTIPPVVDKVTETASEVVNNVVDEVKEVVEEVKEVVKEEPKYEPPVSKKGNKALGF